MPFPKVVYNPGSGDVTLTFQRGPNAFHCYYHAVRHDNVATSGLKESVLERLEMLIEFSMPALTISDATDYPAWAALMKFALTGAAFKFFPNATLTEYYNCTSEDEDWDPQRAGPGKYTVACKWKIVPDASAPADPSVVIKRFYGIAG
jgi:hypothetical protein